MNDQKEGPPREEDRVDATKEGAATSGAKRTGRPPLTDRTRLLAAAHEVAVDPLRGLNKLTVGTVTRRVGVKYSTFYRHFPSFEAMVAALVDEIVGTLEIPRRGESWDAALTTATLELAALAARYVGLAAYLRARSEYPEHVRQLVEALTEMLCAGGFSAPTAALGASFALDTALWPSQSAGEGDSRADSSDTAERLSLLVDGLGSRIAA